MQHSQEMRHRTSQTTRTVLTVISVPASMYSSSKMDAELCSSETSCTHVVMRLAMRVHKVTTLCICTARHQRRSQQGDVLIVSEPKPCRAPHLAHAVWDQHGVMAHLSCELPLQFHSEVVQTLTCTSSLSFGQQRRHSAKERTQL